VRRELAAGCGLIARPLAVVVGSARGRFVVALDDRNISVSHGAYTYFASVIAAHGLAC
jgi:hypothetical protein